MSDRAVVAYQLSLLGEAPRPGYGWRPAVYAWRFAGIPIPLPDDAMRQWRLLRRETVATCPHCGHEWEKHGGRRGCRGHIWGEDCGCKRLPDAYPAAHPDRGEDRT